MNKITNVVIERSLKASNNTSFEGVNAIKKKAFTLAEVLITLAIIGVVAAMTIPTLMQKTNEKETVARVKKAYNTMANAYKLATVKYDTINKWGITPETALGYSARNNEETSEDDRNAAKSAIDVFINRIGENVKFVKVNDAATAESNSYGDAYWLDGSNANAPLINYATFADGSMIRNVYIYADSYCNTNNLCVNFWYDVNGDKGPNTHGKDIFTFYVTKDAVMPIGASTFEEAFTLICDKTKIGKINNGQGCTSWVLYHDNLDYLHCDDLDWNTKTSCK